MTAPTHPSPPLGRGLRPLLLAATLVAAGLVLQPAAGWGQERQAPDAILELSNLAPNAVANIQDDPDSPDGSWLDATANNVTTVVRTSFPTPTAAPAVGANLQEFRVLVRRSAAGVSTPTVAIGLYESGTLVSTLATGVAVTSDSGQVIPALWDAALLATADGSAVEVRVTGTAAGGGPNTRTVDVGAIEWNVRLAAPNTAPTVTITAPADGASFSSGTPVTFTGTATDPEDGTLTGSLSWTSSLDGAIGSGGSFSTSTLSVGTHTITASVTDSGGLAGQDQISITITAPNVAPTVTITAPADGASFTQGTSVAFTGTATDPEDGSLTASLAWTSSVDGTIGSGGSFSTSTLSAGTHTVTASVTDSGGLGGQDQITITITVTGNTAPTVTITAPADGASFTQGSSVTFTGTATDAEDGTLTAGLAWTSSIDGAIGSGGSFTTSALSVGTHTITASVTDSGGLAGQDQVTITVTSGVNAAPTVTISAPVTGTTFAQGTTVVFSGTATDAEDGDLTAGLAWTSSVDGTIGTGGSFSTGVLSVGTHTITASVTDSGGLAGQDQVTITVSANGTTTGTATATASSCSQITASALYTGDADGDGSALVEWSIAGNNAWTTSCAAVGGASPRRCLVIGLAASQSYDIRVTFSDPDGLSGTNPRTVAGVALPACSGTDDAPPTILVLAPERDGILSGTDVVKVQIWDSGAGAHAGLTVTRSVDGVAGSAPVVNPNYDCGTDCRVYESSLDTTVLANGGHALTIQVTDASGNVGRVDWPFRVSNSGAVAAGGGYLLRRTHGSQLCIDCHNLPTHSSQTTDPSYGNWAVGCLDCHTPHDTANIYLIREQILTPNSGRRPVRFEDPSVGAVASSGTPGSAAYVNEDNVSGQADGPCQVCHTRTGGATARWRNAASGGNASSHYTSSNGTPCTDCHTHAGGFKGAGGDCLGCHGDAGGAGTTGPNNRRPVNPDFGRQSHHVGTGGAMGGSLTASDCVVCHAEGTIGGDGQPTTTAWHNNGVIDFKDADDTAAVFSYDKNAIAASAGAAANWHSGDAAWRTQTSTALDPFCLTCHDADGAVQSFNAADGGNAQNPFGDGAITNNYDQMTRPGVIDIASKVSGSPPPQGVFSRHAIRGQSTSKYTRYTAIGTGFRSMYEGATQTPVGTRFTSMGTDENGKPNWNDTSVMGCADCHTTDGANGASGNAHGSASEYLLKDAGGLATEGTFAGNSYVCFRCHANANMTPPYDEAHTGGNASDFQDTVGSVGAARITAASKGYGTRFGMACLNCHGGGPGDGTGAGDTNGFGWIHGSSQVFPTGTGGTRNAYRFMNGGGLRFYTPGGANWDTGTGTCYTLSSANSWSGCAQHGSKGASGGPFLKRPLSY